MKLVRPLDLFKDTEPGSRLMGIHVGSERIGLSISCGENKHGFPLSVFSRNNDILLQASKIKALVSRNSICGFVVGYPFVEGREAPSGSHIKEWVNQLCETKEFEAMSYTYSDLSCYTEVAAEMVDDANFSRNFREPVLDLYVAVVVLEAYLQTERNNEILHRYSDSLLRWIVRGFRMIHTLIASIWRQNRPA